MNELIYNKNRIINTFDNITISLLNKNQRPSSPYDMANCIRDISDTPSGAGELLLPLIASIYNYNRSVPRNGTSTNYGLSINNEYFSSTTTSSTCLQPCTLIILLGGGSYITTQQGYGGTQFYLNSVRKENVASGQSKTATKIFIIHLNTNDIFYFRGYYGGTTGGGKASYFWKAYMLMK